MKKYEYTVLGRGEIEEERQAHHMSGTEAHLNEYGEEGWELVQILNKAVIFKREK